MGTSTAERLLVVGCGFTGSALCRLALADGRYGQVLATTRNPERTADITALGAIPVLLHDAQPVPPANLLAGADVAITYPPEPARDEPLAELCRKARALVYISSTAVYGARRGTIDDQTPIGSTEDRGLIRIAAEGLFRNVGAVVLRAPGIYGPGRGLHRRVREGRAKLTGDGSNHISRIHVEDLAGLCLAALAQGQPGSAHVVGDLQPISRRTAVAYLCERLGLPMAPSQPVEAAHPTLRGDRQVDPRAALAALGYTLKFPNYTVGFDDCLTRDP